MCHDYELRSPNFQKKIFFIIWKMLNFVGLLLRAYAELKTGKKLLALDLCVILSSVKLSISQVQVCRKGIEAQELLLTM